MGDTLFINTYVKNYDSNPYFDSLSFAIKINGVLNVNQNIFPNPFLGNNVNIPVGDSVPASLFVVITPAYFAVGPDILVVWPKADNGATAHDTLVKTIIVVDALDIQDEGVERLRLFYEQGQLHLNLPEGIELNRVRIFNQEGMLLGEQKDTGPVPFSGYPGGIYLADVVYNQNKRQTIRFAVLK